jgi:hypothetical protein
MKSRKRRTLFSFVGINPTPDVGIGGGVGSETSVCRSATDKAELRLETTTPAVVAWLWDTKRVRDVVEGATNPLEKGSTLNVNKIIGRVTNRIWFWPSMMKI